MSARVRRFLGVGLGLFLVLVAPAFISGNASSALDSADTSVPTDDVFEIVLDDEATTTTVVESTSTIEPTTTVAEVLDMGVAEPKYLVIETSVATGQAAAGKATTVSATGVAPNSKVTFTLQPEGIVLAEGTADASGNITLTATLPAKVARGSHLFVAEGTAPTGDQVSSSGAFVVDGTGVVSDLIPASEALSAPPSMEELQRALDAGAPLYDTAANVATTAAVAVGAAVVGTIAAGGAGGGSTSSSSGNSSSDSGSQESDIASGDRVRGSAFEQDDGTSRDTESQGEVGSLDMDDLHRLDHEQESWGDRGKLWRLPGFHHSQQLVAGIYGWADSHSVVLSRVLIDGQWMRAALGPLQLFIAYVGLLLGVLAGISTHGMVILPPIALVFAIMTLSIFDALGGMLASLGFVVVALVSGEITNIFDVRTLLGMAVAFIALPLIGNHARPLRRVTKGELTSWLDRVGDYVLTPIVVAFAASAVLNALNGLSGLQLVQPHDASMVRWVAAIAIVVRLLLEDVVLRGFPQRLIATHLDAGEGLGAVADYGTVFMKGGIFLLASSSFFGLGWRTWVMVGLMTLVPFLKITQDKYPNLWWVKHWFPQGVFRTTMMLFVGSWFAQWVLSTSSSPNAAKELAPLLMLPGIALGFIDLFGRTGNRWPNAVWTRLIAAGFWVFVLGVMLGQFSV